MGGAGPDRRLEPRLGSSDGDHGSPDPQTGYGDDLLGGGYWVSVGLAALLCAVVWAEAHASRGDLPLAPLSSVLSLVAAASAHAWAAQRLGGMGIWARWRHRGIVLLLGASCAWLAFRWATDVPDRLSTAVACLIVLAGAGAAAAAADTLTMALWLVGVIALPAVLAVIAGTAAAMGTAVYLLTSGVALGYLAHRVHSLVHRASAVRLQNDHLFTQLRKQVTACSKARSLVEASPSACSAAPSPA